MWLHAYYTANLRRLLSQCQRVPPPRAQVTHSKAACSRLPTATLHTSTLQQAADAQPHDDDVDLLDSINSTWGGTRRQIRCACMRAACRAAPCWPFQNTCFLPVGKAALDHFADMMQRATWAIPLNQVNFHVKEVRASPDGMKLYLLWDADEGMHDEVEVQLQARCDAFFGGSADVVKSLLFP